MDGGMAPSWHCPDTVPDLSSQDGPGSGALTQPGHCGASSCQGWGVLAGLRGGLCRAGGGGPCRGQARLWQDTVGVGDRSARGSRAMPPAPRPGRADGRRWARGDAAGSGVGGTEGSGITTGGTVAVGQHGHGTRSVPVPGHPRVEPQGCWGCIPGLRLCRLGGRRARTWRGWRWMPALSGCQRHPLPGLSLAVPVPVPVPGGVTELSVSPGRGKRSPRRARARRRSRSRARP